MSVNKVSVVPKRRVGGLKIPISSLNYVINHCTSLQMTVEIVLVYEFSPSRVYFVLESEFVELN